MRPEDKKSKSKKNTHIKINLISDNPYDRDSNSKKLKKLSEDKYDVNTTISLDCRGGPINNKGIKLITNNKNFFSRLTSLDLGRSEIDDSGISNLFTWLSNYGYLKELILDYNEFSDQVLDDVKDGLKKNKSLVYLSLKYAKFSSHDAEILAEAIKDNESLVSIDFTGNKISGESYLLIKAACSRKVVTGLILDNNKIDNSGLLKIAESLKNSHSLVSLNLAGNSFGQSGNIMINEFSNYITDSKISRVFGFGKKQYGIAALAQTLTSSGLKNLNLSNNLIKLEGLQELAKSFSACSLTHIDLTNTGIDNDGIKILSEGLKKNKTLIYVNLSENRFDEEGMINIAKMLEENDTIKHLVMNDFNIKDRERVIKGFIDSMESNHVLEKLDIEMEKIDEGLKETLSDSLKMNHDLQEYKDIIPDNNQYNIDYLTISLSDNELYKKRKARKTKMADDEKKIGQENFFDKSIIQKEEMSDEEKSPEAEDGGKIPRSTVTMKSFSFLSSPENLGYLPINYEK